LLTIYLVI